MTNSDFKILIGDSDLKTLTLIQRILREEEFNAWTAVDPGEILRIIESGDFDLLIFDIKLYAQLKAQNFKIESHGELVLPIIILTTDEDFQLTIEAIKEGAVDFIEKPVKVKRLLVTIRNALLHSAKLKQLRLDQEALASLKELYERIINGIDYGIVVLDQHLRIESVNEHLWRKQRNNGLDFFGKHCYRYFYERSTICDYCRIKEVFLKGTPVKYNLVNKAVGGLNYYLEVEAFPLFDQKGEVNRVVQLIKDVTERVHLEKELLEKKEYLENLVFNAPVGIFTTDRLGFIKTANPAFAQLLGVKSPQDTLGINVLESEDFKKLKLDSEFRQVLYEGKNLDIEAAHCEAIWGRELICSIRCVPIRGVNAEITGLIATVADVTGKWKLEESYRNRITELSIFKAIGELLQDTTDLKDIFYIALIGITAGKGLGFNRAFLFRYDREENILLGDTAIGPADAIEAGRIWSELYEKDFSLYEILEDYKKNRDDRDVQVRKIVSGIRIPVRLEDSFIQDLLFQNNPKIVLKAHESGSVDQKQIADAIGCGTFAAAPFISRGKTEGIIVADNLITGKEITAEDLNRLSIIANQAGAGIEKSRLLQSLEEKVIALRQAYMDLKVNRDLLLRAERLSVVGEVAATVAHEIRNPLTSIGGFTRAVLRDLEKSEKSQTNKRFLTIILEEVKRLEKIVSEILGFARPVTPNYAYNDINDIIEQTFSMMSGEIDENRIVITLDYQKDLPKVWIDEDQFRQVLLNMFRNAVHAMKEGGMLSVITKQENEYVKIFIADTGEGIPKEHKDKLFNAFFTTKSTGSGLGLTVSSQIIKNHGGTIEVESSQGEGSTFTITLPIRSKEEKNEEENSGCRRRKESAHPV